MFPAPTIASTFESLRASHFADTAADCPAVNGMETTFQRMRLPPFGNVAAHFPGETLDFDAKALSFPRKREANQFLTRSYRNGWGMKT